MKYNILINQKAIVDLGLVGKIKANHIAVLEVIISLYISDKTAKINDESGTWVMAKPSHIVKQIPMFDISESRCRQLVIDLAECKLIQKNAGNIFLQGTYLKPGSLYDRYQYFDNDTEKETDVVKKQTGGYQKIDKVRYQKSETSIIGDNTISNNTISDTHIPTPEKKQIEISYSDKPNPKTALELKNKMLLYLNASSDISQEARRQIFEVITKKCHKLPKGLTLPESLSEVVEWWSDRYYSKNRDTNLDYSRLYSALKGDLNYYDSVQPDEKKYKKDNPIKTTGHIIRTQYDENGVPIPRNKNVTI